MWEYKWDIASYVGDRTPYTSNIRLNLVLEKLESSTHDLFRWYKENHMKANPDKCHLLVTTNALTSVIINCFQLTNSTEEKLQVIKFDSKLHFENHVLLHKVRHLCINISDFLWFCLFLFNEIYKNRKQQMGSNKNQSIRAWLYYIFMMRGTAKLILQILICILSNMLMDMLRLHV